MAHQVIFRHTQRGLRFGAFGVFRRPDFLPVSRDLQVSSVCQGQSHPLRDLLVFGFSVPNYALLVGDHHKVAIVLQNESHTGGLGGVGVPEGSGAVDHQVAINLGSRRIQCYIFKWSLLQNTIVYNIDIFIKKY